MELVGRRLNLQMTPLVVRQYEEVELAQPASGEPAAVTAAVIVLILLFGTEHSPKQLKSCKAVWQSATPSSSSSRLEYTIDGIAALAVSTYLR
jgi:hypothetical protein